MQRWQVINGVATGPVISFHHNGFVLQIEDIRLNRIRHGLCGWWGENGQVTQEQYYFNDYPSGVISKWYDRKTLKMIGQYSPTGGKKIGEWKWFDRQGKIEKQIWYDSNGKETRR